MASIVSGGVAKAAFYSDKLFCPYCNGTRWRFEEKVRAATIRYRCKDCHNTVLYDFGANPDHPYKIYGKGVFKRFFEGLKAGYSQQQILQKLKLQRSSKGI
jgi:transposase-like protein